MSGRTKKNFSKRSNICKFSSAFINCGPVVPLLLWKLRRPGGITPLLFASLGGCRLAATSWSCCLPPRLKIQVQSGRGYHARLCPICSLCSGHKQFFFSFFSFHFGILLRAQLPLCDRRFIPISGFADSFLLRPLRSSRPSPARGRTFFGVQMISRVWPFFSSFC